MAWAQDGNIKGPPGTDGTDGTNGTNGTDGADGQRGSNWYTGDGPPTTIAGSLPGDKYLDVISGDVYTLS